MKTSNKIKQCFVPGCESVCDRKENFKLFFDMPVALSRRRLWMKAIGKQGCRDRRKNSICQDHFDVSLRFPAYFIKSSNERNKNCWFLIFYILQLENDAFCCKVTKIHMLKTNAVPSLAIPIQSETNKQCEIGTAESEDCHKRDDCNAINSNKSTVVDEAEQSSNDVSNDITSAKPSLLDASPLEDCIESSTPEAMVEVSAESIRIVVKPKVCAIKRRISTGSDRFNFKLLF